MSDDVFDLGEPADEPDESDSATTDDNSNTANSATTDDTATTDDNPNTANSATTDDTASTSNDASDGGDTTSEPDPTRTSAYDTDYQSTQRTIGVRDETWTDVTDLLEDAQAYSKLDGYREVTKLETYEALFQHVLETCDAKDLASRIQTARHEAHDAP